MNTTDSWGLPRESIPWGPTVDPARCRGTGECVKFCPNNVFEWDAVMSRARVARFHQCVVLCNNCVTICSNGAISFPDENQFLDAIEAARRQQAAPPGNGPGPTPKDDRRLHEILQEWRAEAKLALPHFTKQVWQRIRGGDLDSPRP